MAGLRELASLRHHGLDRLYAQWLITAEVGQDPLLKFEP